MKKVSSDLLISEGVGYASKGVNNEYHNDIPLEEQNPINDLFSHELDLQRNVNLIINRIVKEYKSYKKVKRVIPNNVEALERIILWCVLNPRKWIQYNHKYFKIGREPLTIIKDFLKDNDYIEFKAGKRNLTSGVTVRSILRSKPQLFDIE